VADTVISVEHLSKQYRLGSIGRSSLGQDLRRAWRRLRPGRMKGEEAGAGQTSEASLFWALRDVSFEIARGEALGIIGKNGAGKSTLLKVLSRITAPSAGVVRTKGRIASLLEVGTGFHPDLTGRENVFLNGAILGMSRQEIRGKFDEIVDFSGVEAFIDTPVKRYSSGMYVRLAFAVAAQLEPDIFILDEVLAVGDAAFQRKCLGKMGQAAHQGRAVLFVSHNMVAVQSLCSRALLLVDGTTRALGSSRDVVPQYLALSVHDSPADSERSWPDVTLAPGNDVVRVTSVRVRAGLEDAPHGLITMETPISIEVGYCRMTAGTTFHLTFVLVNETEVMVLTTATGACPARVGHYRSRCTIPGNILNSGSYRLRLMYVEDSSRGTWLDDAVTAFSVEDLRERGDGWMGREPSVIQIPLPWTTEPAGPDATR
jgi:lipopolysaccharide transport system ATP-binding protein